MPRDLTNMQFGLLKAVERTEMREDGYCVWRCSCICGGEAFVNTKRLLRKTVTDCGCVEKKSAHGPVAEDLTGKYFGEWEVLRRAENKKGRVMWVCRCSCGTIKTISAHDLKQGKTHSCRNPVHKNLYNQKDLTSKVFGNLRVLHVTRERDYKGSVLWRCQCERCGRIKDISEDSLVHGHYKSCGCGQYDYGEKLIEYRHFYKGTCVESLGRRRRSDNKTGVTGVSQNKNGTYRCGIRFQGKMYYLGTYTDLNEAACVRRHAEEQLHGTFLKAYAEWARDTEKTGEDKELIFQVAFINGTFSIQSNYLSDYVVGKKIKGSIRAVPIKNLRSEA